MFHLFFFIVLTCLLHSSCLKKMIFGALTSRAMSGFVAGRDFVQHIIELDGLARLYDIQKTQSSAS